MRFYTPCSVLHSVLSTAVCGTCAYQGARNVRFFGKFGVLCFLETLVLRFAFLRYYRPKSYKRLEMMLDTKLSFKHQLL